MSQILVTLSYWLHSLATVVFIGHYLLLSLIYLPALTRQESTALAGTALTQVSRHSRSWLYISLLIFIVTGTYLTFTDPNYLGFADFGNLWGILMLIKHVLIIGMLGMGFFFNGLLHVGPMMSSNNSANLAIRRFRLYSNLMAICGVLVLLLTALAQSE